MADSAIGRDVVSRPCRRTQREGLRAALGPMVALANPLDYHTYIWTDVRAHVGDLRAAMTGDSAIGCLIADFPREDRCDPAAWECLFDGRRARRYRRRASRWRSSPPCPTPVGNGGRARSRRGMIPLHGLDEALGAIEPPPRGSGSARAAGPPSPARRARAPAHPLGGRGQGGAGGPWPVRVPGIAARRHAAKSWPPLHRARPAAGDQGRRIGAQDRGRAAWPSPAAAPRMPSPPQADAVRELAGGGDDRRRGGRAAGRRGARSGAWPRADAGAGGTLTELLATAPRCCCR